MRKADIICLVTGVALGIVAGLGHIESVERHRLENLMAMTAEAKVIEVEKIVEVEVETSNIVDDYRLTLDEDIPVEVQAAAEFCGELYNISPELLEAIAFYESSYRSDAVNGSCKGLMQVKEKCHKERMERLGCTDIWNPAENMLVASDYLHELFETYEDVGIVLMVYNGDSKAFTGKISGYANRILTMAEELERKHGKI